MIEEKIPPIHRILIVGVSGYLGSSLAVALRDEFEVFGCYHKHSCRIEGVHCFQLDVLDGKEILEMTQKLQPRAVLYCAGVHNRNKASEEASRAEAINFKAPTIFFKFLSKNIYFLYFSCDEIFGQNTLAPNQKLYTETDRAMPISTYAKTKYSGENVVLNHGRQTCVFRLGTLYGEIMGSAQIPRRTWLHNIQDSITKKENVGLASNQERTFTYIGDLARAVKNYLNKPKLDSVIYNVAGANLMSIYHFAKMFCEIFDLDTQYLEERTYQHPVSKEFVAEPFMCGLNSEKIQKDYNFTAQNPEEGLKEMHERLRIGWTKKWS